MRGKSFISTLCSCVAMEKGYLHHFDVGRILETILLTPI